MNELNISNEVLLSELHKRIDKGQIEFKFGGLMEKIEKDKSNYYHVDLNIDVGNFVSQVIRDLKSEAWVVRKEKEIQEKELVEYKKQLEALKTKS